MNNFVLTPFMQHTVRLKQGKARGFYFILFFYKKRWKSHPGSAGSALGTHWSWSTGGGGSARLSLSSGGVAMAILSISLDQL